MWTTFASTKRPLSNYKCIQISSHAVVFKILGVSFVSAVCITFAINVAKVDGIQSSRHEIFIVSKSNDRSKINAENIASKFDNYMVGRQL